MRRSLALVPVLGLTVAGLAAAETTRTLRVQLAGDPSRPFAVENLAGSMRITATDEPSVTAIATLHADSDELANSVRFEQVVNDKGVPTLRVRYPVSRHQVYRYPGSGSGGFWDAFFGGNRIRYDGAQVSVNGSRGVLLYADIEVRVPRKAIEAVFKNQVGALSAHGLEGRIRLDSGSGGITAERMKGDLVADTGSGNITASDIEGSFSCDTGSGNCTVSRFTGEALKCDTGSGSVKVEGASARRIAADTGSGTVRALAIDAEEFVADTGSGSIVLETTGARARQIKADTGSVSVKVRLPSDTGFELRADTGSGDIVSHFSDAQAILHRTEVVGYRRGDARVRITADTGSGDVVVEPVR
jgi:hypothetical protein